MAAGAPGPASAAPAARRSSAESRNARAAGRARSSRPLPPCATQRQAVRRILEQRVIRDFDLVIVDARRPRIEPDWIGVSDEVDVVPAVGQLEPQLGCDNAAAP